jgi:phosphopantetheinyl transferase
LFNISYSGDIAIISHSKKIGKIKVNLYQTDRNGNENLSIDAKEDNNEYKLISPHEQIEKTIYFIL